MTTEQMPFAAQPGSTVTLLANVQNFILYLGPTLPPAEVFTRENINPTPEQIDVFFRAPDGTFPFWSSVPIPSTLTLMETGKVYSVRINAFVDAVWTVPGSAVPGNGTGPTTPSVAIVSTYSLVDLPPPRQVPDGPVLNWLTWSFAFQVQEGCHQGELFSLPDFVSSPLDTPITLTVPPCVGQPAEDIVVLPAVLIISEPIGGGSNGGGIPNTPDTFVELIPLPEFTLPKEGGDFTVSFTGKSVTKSGGLFSGTTGILLAAAALGGLFLIGRKK